MTARSPDVAVVVPSHDRPAGLARLLDGLAAQTLPRERFEVVVAHDSSGPETEEILRAHPLAREGVLRHLSFAPGPGPAQKRNAGWREARAPLVAFTDDDCRPETGWLEGLLDVARANPGAIVQGATQPDPEELHLARRAGARSQAIDPPSPHAQTCNILYPREMLERLDGFEERLPVAAGEDTDLAWRALDAGRRARRRAGRGHLPLGRGADAVGGARGPRPLAAPRVRGRTPSAGAPASRAGRVLEADARLDHRRSRRPRAYPQPAAGRAPAHRLGSRRHAVVRLRAARARAGGVRAPGPGRRRRVRARGGRCAARCATGRSSSDGRLGRRSPRTSVRSGCAGCSTRWRSRPSGTIASRSSSPTTRRTRRPRLLRTHPLADAGVLRELRFAERRPARGAAQRGVARGARAPRRLHRRRLPARADVARGAGGRGAGQPRRHRAGRHAPRPARGDPRGALAPRTDAHGRAAGPVGPDRQHPLPARASWSGSAGSTRASRMPPARTRTWRSAAWRRASRTWASRRRSPTTRCTPGACGRSRALGVALAGGPRAW